MSYEIVKRLRIENGEVLITSDSNNVFPKYFVERKCTYLTDLLQEQGEEALNIYILKAYEEGNFQEGNPNKWSKAISRLQRTPEYEKYNWRKSQYGTDCPINKLRYAEDQTEFHKLLLSSLTLKEPTEKYIIRNTTPGRESYVSKVTSRLVKYHRDIKEAKVFKYKDEAQYLINMFNFLEIVTINGNKEEVKQPQMALQTELF
jgi:hypothetical protein